MNAVVLLTLAIIIPVITIPVAFVWYVNFGGILHAVRQTRSTTVRDEE